MQTFVQKNEGLRLRLQPGQGEVTQYVSEFHRVKLDFCDFSQEADPEAAFHQWAKKEARSVMPLFDAALYYFALFKINASDQGYLIRVHHLIADGWSFNIMTEKIGAAFLNLGAVINEANPPSYLAYLDLERTYLLLTGFSKTGCSGTKNFKTCPWLMVGQLPVPPPAEE